MRAFHGFCKRSSNYKNTYLSFYRNILYRMNSITSVSLVLNLKPASLCQNVRSREGDENAFVETERFAFYGIPHSIPCIRLHQSMEKNVDNAMKEETKNNKKNTLASIDERHTSFDGLDFSEHLDGLSESEKKSLRQIAIKLVDGIVLNEHEEKFIFEKAGNMPALVHDRHHAHERSFIGKDLSKYDEKQLRRKMKAKILFGSKLDSDEEDFAFRRDLA